MYDLIKIDGFMQTFGVILSHKWKQNKNVYHLPHQIHLKKS